MSILELVGPAEGGDGGHLLGAVLLVARVPAHAVVVAVAAPGAVDAVAVAALEPAVRTPADNNSRYNIDTAILNVANLIQIPASQRGQRVLTQGGTGFHRCHRYSLCARHIWRPGGGRWEDSNTGTLWHRSYDQAI